MHAAQLADSVAHRARNHVAAVLASSTLVDDAEVATALREAGHGMLLLVERIVAAARVELGSDVAGVQVDVSDLLAAGARRARREGLDPTPSLPASLPQGQVTGPGVLLERLVADLLHGAGTAGTVGVVTLGTAVELVFAPATSAAVERDYLAALARACDASIAFDEDQVVARLQLPGISSLPT